MFCNKSDGTTARLYKLRLDACRSSLDIRDPHSGLDPVLFAAAQDPSADPNIRTAKSQLATGWLLDKKPMAAGSTFS